LHNDVKKKICKQYRDRPLQAVEKFFYVIKFVIPAKARLPAVGRYPVICRKDWIPVSTGMTAKGLKPYLKKFFNSLTGPAPVHNKNY
jgi:hypothetical protein